ncbi:hypothetical protein Nmel_008379 [Mimus melanotis]
MKAVMTSIFCPCLGLSCKSPAHSRSSIFFWSL